ncbi:MAG: O-antigen ligase family protein [Akkermansiaceae bacterium]
MIRALNTVLCCLGLLLAGLLGLTLSLPMQAPALVSIGLGGLLGGLLVFQNVPNWRLAVPALIAIVYFILRASMSPVVDLAMEDIFLVSAAGLFYLLAGPIGGTVGLRVSLALVVVVLLILHLGAALQQSAGGEGYGLIWQFTNKAKSEGNVVTGMYSYRGSFANFAVIAAILSLCLGAWGRFAITVRTLFVLLGAAAIVFACMAHSRSAMISLVVGGVVLLVMLWISAGGLRKVIRRRVRTGLVILGCTGLLMTVAGAVLVFKNRAQHTAAGSDVMFDSDVRLAYWSMAAEQFGDHPIFGAGSRSFSYESFIYWSPNLDTGEANPEFVHNEYLQLLADYGILGFLIAVILLGGHIFVGIARVRALAEKLPEDGLRVGSNAMALAIAGVVGIVVMALHNVFDFRTHLMANLLLLMCCLVWVLPVVGRKPSGQASRLMRSASALIALVMAAVGVIAVYSGLKELRGGIPLLVNKMAAETGTWDPSNAPRKVWIPALEESVKLAPSYRRHLRLATLYRLEAEDQQGDGRQKLMYRAISEYKKVANRHPYEAVSLLNLASLHTYLKDYNAADSYFQRADKLAESRERWFRIRTKWADMHRQWAGYLWLSGEVTAAESHYARALKILDGAMPNSEDTRNMYLMIIIENVRMQDGVKNFEASDQLLDYAKEKLPMHVINSARFNIRREMGDHYLRKGKFLWYKRKPEEAYKVLKEAERSYRIHEVVIKGREDDKWKKSYAEVKGILKFFKDTGVGN